MISAQSLSAADLWALFQHFVLMSLLAIGGAIGTVPDMQRFIVGERGWLSEHEFTSSVALAQAAPGPNLLFVAVLGWNIAGAAGVLVTMVGMLLPSTTLTLAASRFARERRGTRGVRAFSAGMAPITVGLLFATGYVLAEPYLHNPAHRIGASLLMAATVLAMTRSKISPMWLMGAGALAGAFGLA